MTIALLNFKPGSGKTTIAVNLAFGLSELGHKVLLIDADPQARAVRWQQIANSRAFAVAPHCRPRSRSDIEALARGYGQTVIDTPSACTGATRLLLAVSDLAIVPVGLRPLDLPAARESAESIAGMSADNPNLQGRLLLCQRALRARLSRETRQAVERLGLRMFATEIGKHQSYVTAMMAGLSVLQYPQCEAAAEIRSLCEEVVDSGR